MQGGLGSAEANFYSRFRSLTWPAERWIGSSGLPPRTSAVHTSSTVCSVLLSFSVALLLIFMQGTFGKLSQLKDGRQLLIQSPLTWQLKRVPVTPS